MKIIFKRYKMKCDTIGFDDNHYHAIIDLARWSVTSLVKVVKGTSGEHLLQKFPMIKKKFFLGIGIRLKQSTFRASAS